MQEFLKSQPAGFPSLVNYTIFAELMDFVCTLGNLWWTHEPILARRPEQNQKENEMQQKEQWN